MKRHTLLSGFFLALVLTVVQGCLSTESPSPGGLRGNVTDASARAMSGVRVSTTRLSTLTDVYGNWTLNDLEPQMQTVTAEKDGYEAQSRSIEVRSGMVGEGANFMLIEKGTIFGITVGNLTSSGAQISFQSKVLLKGAIEYGLNTLYEGKTAAAATFSTAHAFPLTGLTPATTYHYVCVGTDEKGRTFRTADAVFTTAFTRRGDPPQNVQITKEYGSDLIAISWSADTSADLAGYRVYRGATANGPWTSLESKLMQNTRYLDSGVAPGEKVFYHVTRLSGTGEESPPSQVVSFLLPGIARTNLVWRPEQGPFVLTGDLTVRQDSSLTILNGVQVGVASSDQWDLDPNSDRKVELKVTGALVVEGNSPGGVTFTSLAGTPQAGDWIGITFDRVANLQVSRITGLSLNFAQNGIRGLTGIPRITNSRISNCSAAGINCREARVAVDIASVTVDTCSTGFSIASNTAQTVLIASSTAVRCFYGIVSRDNLRSNVVGNKVQFWSITGIDVGNMGIDSQVNLNVVGPGSNGSAVVCRGLDEVRRNTVQGKVGIEIRDFGKALLRSNLILADAVRGDIGVLYSGTTYSAASHVFQNNNIWSQSAANMRYRDASGNALSGVSFDLALDPSLQGGSPFGEFPSASFNYVPSPGSALKGQGYTAEDVGAYNVP